MATEKYNRLDMIKAIEQAKGKTSLAAHLLGCTAETIRNYAKRYATVAQALEATRLNFKTGLVDAAEIKLEEAVRDGKPWAVKYSLATQGKDRGYTERTEQEISGKDGGPIVMVNWDDDETD